MIRKPFKLITNQYLRKQERNRYNCYNVSNNIFFHIFGLQMQFLQHNNMADSQIQYEYRNYANIIK